jgi:hypothetical protein
MNRDEQLVDVYLKSLALGSVAFEPDGNIPPDFLIDDRIAVECRRLNQHYLVDGRPRGLEEDSIPLLQSIERLLGIFPPHRDGSSWFLLFRIRRPLSHWRQLRPKLKAALEQFLAKPDEGIAELRIEEGFLVRIAPASPNPQWRFAIGAFTDTNAGGWLVAEIVRNLSAYVEDKSKKAAQYRDKYRIWWLIFVDYIGYARDVAEVRRHFARPAEWDKILLLSPVDGTACEI